MSTTETQQTPEAILKLYWGFEHFRSLQREIIEHVLDGTDTVALLPTGGGKSICYQVPALLMSGVCLVISPLIALMQDQVQQLKERGIAAEALHSGMHRRQVDRILDNCVYGNIRLLYLSPERLQSDLAMERIKRMHVSLVAVDEAHCISQWGYDFRPAYMDVGIIREWHPQVPFLALTASATPAVAQDIAKQLKLHDYREIRSSFARSNLSLLVYEREDKATRLIEILNRVSGTKLVYVRSRNKAREIAESLTKSKIRAESYHAGMAHDLRHQVQQRWINGVTPVVVSTTAFGMGIDKANVRAVVHYDLPASPEEYYQEAGRAGRDGEEAFCVLLYQSVDRKTLEQRWRKTYPTPQEMARVYRALMGYFKLPIGGGKGMVLPMRLAEFAKTYDLDISKSYHCLKALEMDGWIILNEAFHRPTRIQFILNKEQLYQYQLQQPDNDTLIKALLRNYEGMFLEPVAIREYDFMRHMNISEDVLRKILAELQQDRVITYEAASDDPQVIMLRERVADENLSLDLDRIISLRHAAGERLQALFSFLDEKLCRELALLRYFGEDRETTCGKCDLCRARHSTVTHEEVLQRIGGGMSVRELVGQFPASQGVMVREYLRFLESEELIETRGDVIYPVQQRAQ